MNMEECKSLLCEDAIPQQTDMKTADIFLTYDKELAKKANNFYSKRQTKQNAYSVGSAKIESLFKKSQRLHSPRKRFSTIIFVVSLLYGNSHRSNWTDIQTFKLQQRIVDVFKFFPKIKFIIKGLQASDAAYNPLPEYIRDKGYSNCQYVRSGKFINIMNRADAYIFDFGSTAMFEAMATDKTIILYDDYLKPLPQDINLLKKRIHIVSKTKQLKKIIRLYCTVNQDKLSNNREYLMKYIIPRYNSGGAIAAAVNLIFEKIGHGKK
ncbi:hypothetical protein HZB94_02890 [Candidatus Falkowbacteria bacterium]|nr:hypothetical protein [Candidatus Falkowbacteria bacterium]